MAVQGLWAGPWLRDVAGLSREAAAVHLLVMALATMAGFLFWGNFATGLARRGVSDFSVFAAGMGGFLVLQLLVTVGLDVARLRCCGSASDCSAPPAACPMRSCRIAFRPRRPAA